MIENAFFVPILPGKTPAAREFCRALMNERKAEMDLAQTTVVHEAWFLQQTPMGDFMIVYYLSPDPEKVHQGLAESREPFDVWFKDQILDICGVDINTPLPGLPEQILSWRK